MVSERSPAIIATTRLALASIATQIHQVHARLPTKLHISSASGHDRQAFIRRPVAMHPNGVKAEVWVIH